MNSYPWYEVVSGTTFEHGDILTDFPIPVPNASDLFDPPNENTVRGTIETYDVIILTQSCDLEHGGKVANVLVCPLFEYSQAATKANMRINAEEFGRIRRGHRPPYHLLEACAIPNYQSEHRIVHFGMINTTYFDNLRIYTQNHPERLRLLSPYREHLSQAFARFIVRVGLPQDISDLPKIK